MVINDEENNCRCGFSAVLHGSAGRYCHGGTRVIYQEGKREAAISVTNADTHTPYLVQSWVENYAENDKSKVPFIVTPPLFRLDPEQNNVLRINFIGASLPGDRESVFWLNVKSISPTPQGEVNKLQVNIKSKFKIFYRPTVWQATRQKPGSN